MNTLIRRASAVGVALLLAGAPALSAHEGHAGNHGWLAGASQPLLSLDHLLAALFIVAVGSLGAAFVALAARRRELG